MKTINYLLGCMLVAVGILAACSPDPVKDYIPVNNGSVTNIAGTWNGMSVIQRDVSAENKNFPYKSQNITAPMQFDKVKLTLNGSVSGTFNITYGTAPAFFKFNTGNWSVDNQEKAGRLFLVNGTDTMTMVIGSYNFLLDNKLQLTQTKTLLGRPAIIYEFLFSK